MTRIDVDHGADGPRITRIDADADADGTRIKT
jgi:hypothetical protein